MIKTLRFSVTGQRIEITEPAMLVAGTVNIYTAAFDFDEDWDGFQRTAVFSCNCHGSDVEREQLLTDDACTVPWEVLAAGGYLRVGVYGTKDGTRLPTIWTGRTLYINSGAGPTEEAAEPSPTLVEQLLDRVGDPAALKTEEKSSLVAAINEALESGGGTGGGTTDHAKLTNRGADDQHPMSAITGLVKALEGKQPAGDYLTQETDPTVPAWAKEATKPSYTAAEVGADPSGTAASQVAAHNTGTDAHSDIRLLIQGLTDRLNALADSDDTTLDQLSEIVAYIKSNRDLIASITTDKVSVSDIIDNLTTNVSNKPLSAAQGVALKALIDAITVPTVDDTLTASAAAADAAAVGKQLSLLSEGKVSLPKDTDGNTIPGTKGWYAVSDGAGGITWAESAPSTGDDSGDSGDSGGDSGDTGGDTGGEVLDTSPVVGTDNKECGEDGNLYNNENTFVTEFFDFPEILQASTNKFTLVYATPKDSDPVGTPKLQCFNDDTYVTYWSQQFAVYGSDSNYEKTNVFSGGYGTINKFRMTIFKACKDVSYAYWKETGEVLFAGVESPYYGMANINDSSSTTALSYDDDVAQNYAVSTASILGEETATDTSTAYGISSSLAAVIDEVRKAWMIEYGGDYRKIPLIITTDQHGRTNSGIFNMLGKTLSLHDVSKIMNLGDTVAVEWNDADSEHPLLSCAQLENWCESIKEIPFSKRLDVYGNHDSWYYDGYSVDGNAIGTRYPSTMHHLDQYFRNIYARRNNNHGWGAIYDDYFNVKYVIVTGFEYKDGSSTNRISTEQMTWIVSELEKNDGYDVVIVSHIPLRVDPSQMILPTADTYEDVVYHVSNIDTDAMFAARKTGGAGTITDSDGVEHTYDFSRCENPVLCSLHGHTHEDAYLYLNDSLLVNAFDWFDENTFFFVLIDRVNDQLNIWKVEGDALTYQNYQIPFDKPAE